MRGLLVFSAILAAATGILAGCGDDGGAPPGELIAFSSDQDGDWDVYLLDPNAGIARKVTGNDASDLNPDVSPDGKRVLFSSNFLDGERSDYRIQTDEGWVHVDDEILGDQEIYVVDAGGENLERLTENNAIDEQPAWSPDGSLIAFQSDVTGDVEIHVMDADGSNMEQLTNSPGNDWSPTWSPDGTRIAFASDRNGNWDIFTMDSTGSDVVQITDDPGMDWLPAWSPDGGSIAFTSDRDPTWEVYVVASSGGGTPTNVTNSPGTDTEPVWSPDGSRLLFASDRGGSQGLYTMDADGSNVVELGQAGLPFSWVSR